MVMMGSGGLLVGASASSAVTVFSGRSALGWWCSTALLAEKGISDRSSS